MKAIMISIKPKWYALILNGEKTIEIRKTMPKCDLPVDVYIYCTKDKKSKVFGFADRYSVDFITSDRHRDTGLSGLVVAKFTLKKVEYYDKHWYCLEKDFDYEKELKSYDDIKPDDFLTQEDIDSDIADLKLFPQLLKESCLTQEELYKYRSNKSFYAWYIDDLVIFDEPKELSEFKQPRDSYGKVNWNANEYYYMELTKAPQSFCYVEVEEK